MNEALILLQRGGIVMVPLLICSVTVLAVVIERSISLRRKRVLRPEIINLIDTIKKPEDIPLAISICHKNDGPFVNIVQFSLENVDVPNGELTGLVSEQGRQEVRSLEKGLVILETIAGIAPLLGLLGTVLGMIKVFTVVSQQGVGQAQALSGGISEALLTTVVGLSIGIPALVVFNLFTNKAGSMAMDIEKFVSRLLRKLTRFQSNAFECNTLSTENV
ncbi:MAG: MotA/TolQ/ExbB proton channel family protein [Gemmatimonadota bacterium]|nr:MAG: MotA/TolQ/ExbB proton channel family protein [Gemmatimonadota bacterium]